MGEVFTLNSAHNFGIYTKSGKRTIFQIDFSDKRISLIEKGKISKGYDFSKLEQYDSEDNLHIVIRFRNGKTIEFDADTAEEKYTICRLLGIILEQGGARTTDIIVPGSQETQITQQLSTRKQVIKEGLLDKKGNTKIPTWSRRRLQVCPGEFSYYRTGDEVALNLVQLWENCFTVKPSGQSSFTVEVRDRAYQFKVVGEKGRNVEAERDAWIQAFQQASQRKRATFLLLEMSKQTDYSKQGVPQSPEDTEDVSYYNQNTTLSTYSSSDSNSSRELLEGLEVINELDEVLNEESLPSEGRNISLSVVQKTSPMLATPTRTRARPPAASGIKGGSSTSSEEQATYDFIPEPDYSPPPSPKTPTGREPSGKSTLEREKQASGVYKNVIERTSNDFRVIERSKQSSGVYKQAIERSNGDISTLERDKQSSGVYKRVIEGQVSGGQTSLRESGLYSNVIRNESDDQRHSGEKVKATKPAPGAVNVMSNFTEIPRLRRTGSRDAPSDNTDKTSKDSEELYKNTSQNTYVNTVADIQAEKSDKVPSPWEKTKPAPAPPPGAKWAPPPPVGSIPAPPPCSAPTPPGPRPTVKAGKGKLKQIHWTRTPKPLIANSIWERPHDMTPMLNLRLLEEQFAVKERDPSTLPGPKSPTTGKPQLLVDAKRAQILDIFISGLKGGGARRLVEVLNSVTECDDFPAEKLTTIRRYQPTEDEIDMYKAYAHKRHELHPVDLFMLELCEIPCLNIRIDICLTIWEFPWQFESTCQLVDQVHSACDELLNSQMLVLVLEYILAIGNHLNKNWGEGNATSGFQVTSLDKVLSVRGKDSGYTIVHFLVEQLRQSDPRLLQWPDTVQMVKKCEQVSVKSVAAESEVLKCDLSKVKKHLKNLKSQSVYTSRQDNKFLQDAQNLTVEYEMKLERLDRSCGDLQNKYRKILTRFGEPLYQRSDQMFAVIADFADKFKAAMKDLDTKGSERRPSLT